MDYKNNSKFMNKQFEAVIIIFVIIILTISLDWIIFVINETTLLSLSGLASLSDKILFATFLALIWYAWETKGMKREMVYQSELQSMPFLAIYVRNIKNISKEEKKAYIENNFAIDRLVGDGLYYPTHCYLVLRNMGKGVALDIKINSNKFIVQKYATRIIAPETDEQPFKILKKGNNKGEEMEDPKILNKNIFYVTCRSMEKIEYCFKYKILDLYKNEIEYLGYKKIV